MQANAFTCLKEYSDLGWKAGNRRYRPILFKPQLVHGWSLLFITESILAGRKHARDPILQWYTHMYTKESVSVKTLLIFTFDCSGQTTNLLCWLKKKKSNFLPLVVNTDSSPSTNNNFCRIPRVVSPGLLFCLGIILCIFNHTEFKLK